MKKYGSINFESFMNNISLKYCFHHMQSQHKKAKKDKKKRDRLKRRSLRTPTIRTSHHDDNDDADHAHPSEFLPRRHGSTGPQTSNLRAHPTTYPHLPPTQWSVITPRDVQLQGSTAPVSDHLML